MSNTTAINRLVDLRERLIELSADDPTPPSTRFIHEEIQRLALEDLPQQIDLIHRSTHRLRVDAHGDPELVAALLAWLDEHDPMPPGHYIKEEPIFDREVKWDTKTKSAGFQVRGEFHDR